MKNWKVCASSRVGTSLQGEFTASYAEVARVFGEAETVDGDKVSTQWTLKSPGGKVHAIYDYKATNVYEDDLPSVEEFRAEPSYRWHVGAFSTAEVQSLKDYLSEKLGRTVV